MMPFRGSKRSGRMGTSRKSSEPDSSDDELPANNRDAISTRSLRRPVSAFSLPKDEVEMYHERKGAKATERIFMPAEDSISWMIQVRIWLTCFIYFVYKHGFAI